MTHEQHVYENRKLSKIHITKIKSQIKTCDDKCKTDRSTVTISYITIKHFGNELVESHVIQEH